MTEPGAAIELRHVSHTFGDGRRGVAVLDDVSLAVEPRSFVSLVGPSGCGKSTILRILAGLLSPSAGEAYINSVDTAGRPGLAAFMPQKDLLLPWRRALANTTLGAEVAGQSKAEAQRRARELLDVFGLEGFEDAWPSQLSGGMRQRVALLRTFLLPGNALLLDEPFGALDAITRREMQSWLQDVWLRDRRTVLLVTHDVEEALVLSDVVYVMSPRPGRIVATVEVPFARPRDSAAVTHPEFVALRAKLLTALAAG
jgi:ABC-type nitrate/sulfonate/bicarbonate transport system ATPase subunit